MLVFPPLHAPPLSLTGDWPLQATFAQVPASQETEAGGGGEKLESFSPSLPLSGRSPLGPNSCQGTSARVPVLSGFWKHYLFSDLSAGTVPFSRGCYPQGCFSPKCALSSLPMALFPEWVMFSVWTLIPCQCGSEETQPETVKWMEIWDSSILTTSRRVRGRRNEEAAKCTLAPHGDQRTWSLPTCPAAGPFPSHKAPPAQHLSLQDTISASHTPGPDSVTQPLRALRKPSF